MTTITSTATTTAAIDSKSPAAFWERIWRGAGIQFVGLALIGLAIYGFQPAGPFIAVPLLGLAILNLTWFAAALRTTLADAGMDGWGAAATAASAVVAGTFFVLLALGVGQAYSVVVSGSETLMTRISEFGWAGFVVSSFPRAMLIMAGSFGLWRAGLISKSLFAAGVTAVVLVLLGGTTWFADGFWAPDGAYSRFISPAIGLVWVAAAGRVLAKLPSTRTGF